jgi:hypothetical protein
MSIQIHTNHILIIKQKKNKNILRFNIKFRFKYGGAEINPLGIKSIIREKRKIYENKQYRNVYINGIVNSLI